MAFLPSGGRSLDRAIWTSHKRKSPGTSGASRHDLGLALNPSYSSHLPMNRIPSPRSRRRIVQIGSFTLASLVRMAQAFRTELHRRTSGDAQLETTAFTREWSQVQSLSRPPDYAG